MTGGDWAEVIKALGIAIPSILTAIFGGLILFRQNPRIQRTQEETKAKVESIEAEQVQVKTVTADADAKLAHITNKLDVATAAALAASKAREMPMPDAAHPLPVTVADTPIAVTIENPKER